MKHTLLKFAALAVTAIGAVSFVGCGDDPVNPTNPNPYLQFKTNDTFRFEVYDRDSSNARVANSKRSRFWIVTRTGLTYEGKNDVSEIVQIDYNANGNTEVGRDTLYFQSTSTGDVYQHNVLGSIVSRFQADYADSIPETWAKLTQTKENNATTWSSTGGQVTANVTIPVIGAGKMFVSMDASHKGRKDGVTIGSKSYNLVFQTDHTVKLTVQQGTGGLTILNDSMKVHYDFDITNGLLGHSLDSKTIVLPPPFSLSYPVQGYEMVFVSATRVSG